ncbi:MAG: tRNA (adenosine(37)-N6)-threonylcarbamoyltransferase complex ATPase subunit type 1 TsaE [Fibrobacter sp.]|jgi:tRNA threonylcarbamoyladenosine biosynthesis protein TsaE|nr:tRNA (adenosine(37)-N6)-threonylcarbamoyltransferase complex ATPase subunit type 1 TsaE [Fibrobacter sp.]
MNSKTEVITCGEKETEDWAGAFARTLSPGAVIALSGNLGAGKTALSRGICKALGFRGQVSSPTYTIVHEYPNTPPIYHLDLYRLNSVSDLSEIGLDYYAFNQGITLIEWAERLENQETGITHFIRIEILSDNERKITVS